MDSQTGSSRFSFAARQAGAVPLAYRLRDLAPILLAGLLLEAAAGCEDEGPVEEAAEETEDAVEEAADEVEDAAGEIEDELQ